jgi:alginate O-acetyltransferase complex protein AlgI
MIFSSNAFIFAFLPIALIGYYLIARLGLMAANGWLVAASLIFYSFWEPWFVIILLGSITWNFSIGAWIYRLDESRDRQRLTVLWLGIIGNLLILSYYKYLFPLLGFLASHHLAPDGWVSSIALPLGISFFTFTQIGYLLDSYDGRAKERGLLSYMVFVTFFPHLIAGPILHNREILPQLSDPRTKVLQSENISVGLAMFIMGLGKKVLLADPLGFVADRGFAQVHDLSTIEAWVAALAYSLQLYFDFSGYSDMAIGLARMFGIIFPVNFNSPYKARSIIDFWSRWHMTLTRYLTLYLYNPVAMRVNRRRVARGLSTSRKGTRNVPAFLSLIAVPTFYTMILAGVWHGAGLQFLIFGLLHAVYLSINHAWRVFGPEGLKPIWWRSLCFLLLTYGAVLSGQIFFRAVSAQDATTLLGAMFGHGAAGAGDVVGMGTLVRIVLGFAICLALPNSQQILRHYRPILEKVTPIDGISLSWRPNLMWGLFLGGVALAALLRMSDVSTFLYFQF